MCLLPGCLFVKEDRRTDEDARKGDQSPVRTNVGDSADCTGENGDVTDGRQPLFSTLLTSDSFILSDPVEILLETNANPADSDYLL